MDNNPSITGGRTYPLNQILYDDNKNIILQLKKEQLDIVKRYLQIGEVNIYRETLTEEKSFTIPVVREDLVIETRDLSSLPPEYKDAAPKEVIRIPLSEEHVEFTKHKVDLEEVSIYKEQVHATEKVEKTLKREELKVKIHGTPKVLYESNQNH
jgi:uncharacterized protein (TIGR02271 family)